MLLQKKLVHFLLRIACEEFINSGYNLDSNTKLSANGKTFRVKILSVQSVRFQKRHCKNSLYVSVTKTVNVYVF